jgi:sugar lactone lactonase YvrE
MPDQVTWYPFTEHPEADSCWSLSVGPDGRIYVASCAESAPGGIVKLARYNRSTDALEYLFDLDKAVDDPRDSGRATQCKIHYSFAPSLADGILYMATHLSGPPIDQPAYSPWNSWHDPERCFRGSALLAFDTRTDTVLWWDTLIPKEGCRCLLLDPERGLLYALGYPRDHMIRYDIARREQSDLGRIGSINSQVLFSDRKHRVWTTDDYGHLVRYDPAKGRIERSPYVLPHNPQYQTGWHSVLYDAAASPDGQWVYAVTWNGSPYMMRIAPDEGEWGRVESLGPVTPEADRALPEDYFIDHCGGLVFAGDGCLYYVASRWQGTYRAFPGHTEGLEGAVWRLDTQTLQREQAAVLHKPSGPAQYVSRGAVDASGDLFFGNVGFKPVGMFKVALPPERRRADAHLPLRVWG